MYLAYFLLTDNVNYTLAILINKTITKKVADYSAIFLYEKIKAGKNICRRKI